jgi:hypothetical protein
LPVIESQSSADRQSSSVSSLFLVGRLGFVLPLIIPEKELIKVFFVHFLCADDTAGLWM